MITNKHYNIHGNTLIMRFDLDDIRCYSSQTWSNGIMSYVIRINSMYPIFEQCNNENRILDINEFNIQCKKYNMTEYQFIQKIIEIFNIIYNDNND